MRTLCSPIFFFGGGEGGGTMPAPSCDIMSMLSLNVAFEPIYCTYSSTVTVGLTVCDISKTHAFLNKLDPCHFWTIPKFHEAVAL